MAKLPGLSEQQRVGLKYFEDFENRISREEAAEAESLLTDAMVEVFEVGASCVGRGMNLSIPV